MTEPEITELAITLLRLCDRAGRNQVAGLAIGMWLATFPDGEQQRALAELVRDLQSGKWPLDPANRC